MIERNYSVGITVKGAKREGSQIVSLKKKFADEFINATVACLDSLKNTKTGGKLIQAINESGHDVSIYRAFTADTGNSQGGGGEGEFVVPLDEVHGDGMTELHRVLDRACEDLSGRSKLKKFLNIGKARPRFLNRDALARLVGLSPKQLAGMEAGKTAFDDRAKARLLGYLYDFLTPGDGEDCYVLFNHTRDNLSPDHKKYLPASHTWQNRPPAIALGHELIHAWRVAVGRVLYPYGWEEEAMTVGLPPFGNMEFTENRIRVDWGGLAIRPDYEHIKFKTGMFTPGEKSKVGIAEGTNTWQGKQSSLHANQGIAQTMAQRRKAMGYDDDDDDGDGDDDGF